MKTLGICFGTSTLQAIGLQINKESVEVVSSRRIVHDGDPAASLLRFFEEIDAGSFDCIAVTGRAFRKSVKLTSITEPNAVECALASLYAPGEFPDAVISSGAETQLVYRITRSGGIGAVHSGNKCASGSGEFFLQQIRRIGLSIEEAVTLAGRGTPYKIAGRCSVFCKSDCTHALNKGEPRENIVTGLCCMMADKIVDLVRDRSCRHVVFVGGGALNTALTDLLRKRFDRVDTPQPVGCFEAYGAALWASKNPCVKLPADRGRLINAAVHSFGHHKPLRTAIDLVDFRPSQHAPLREGDDCILGLDVGSTTTKAVLIRRTDRAIVASVYLRTGGDPIQASRNCYISIRKQTGTLPISISGLGVTGSGRHIAALHALTTCVINEIIAHATAAAHFAADVDTIFEIGGQDAKYTFLTNGVPSDYAMNEACSAGTGSFLEEAARESLNVATEEIGEEALCAENPPNFTDQCAAFIGSDIKLAGQEGIGRNDILAGLVYSICCNYLNRVKGARPVGKKIFMQGGVCYNRAVPLAMASLMGTQIIVPPDPGLMGAFGVALEVLNRMELGSVEPAGFNLDQLIGRKALRESSFVCNGGIEKCDRKCTINRIRLDGKIYPFGGVCNRYYNLRMHRDVDTRELDLVALREKLLFEEFGVRPCAPDGVKGDSAPRRPRVGIMRSFLVHSLYPLYSNFFHRIGFDIVLADVIDREGIAKAESEFCLPAEISHGSFYRLIELKPEYIFCPQVMQIPVPQVPTYSRACVFVQGEPYYLKTTFREELDRASISVLSPVLRMDTSYEAAMEPIVDMAVAMGVGEKQSRDAFAFACERQREFEERLLQVGSDALERLGDDPSAMAVVLFGRPYNSFTKDANMGIPHKIASRGIMVIPHDMLLASHYPVDPKMFWAMGQKIMKSAQFVKERENLFGCYITNFSCGPDSFLLGYFRRVMDRKPSLTLELDEHTADAGIDTRIEAALDIMSSFLKRKYPEVVKSAYRPARVIYDPSIQIVSSHGRKLPLRHPDVEVVIPSMGRFATESVGAILRSAGVNVRVLNVSDAGILREGRACTSCKECLPYILTTGSFMNYIRERKDTWKVTLFLMATGGGPCRLGQYCVALGHLIERERMENVAVLTITDENGYGGLGSRILLRSWQAIIVSDVFSDIRSVLAVAAKDRSAALSVLESVWREMLLWFEGKLSVRISTLLDSVALRLKTIPLKCSPDELPVVSLIGEIYVRRDEFSRKDLVDYLEAHGFMVRVAPMAEYLCYGNYVINTGLGERQFTLREKMRMRLVARIQEWWENRIKSLLSQSGLYRFEMIEVEKTIESARHLMSENMRGETILTVGLGLREILNDSCGIVSIGPFGCMPSRMSEAMLKKEMNAEGKARLPGWGKRALQYEEMGSFPFIAVETDGSPFPQLVEANLEAFVLQARRLHERMKKSRSNRAGRRIWRHLPVMLLELVRASRPQRSRMSK